MIRDCEELGVLARRPHALGDVLFMDERTAALASYHRNNVVHLFVLPALVAATFNNRYEVGAERIADLVARLYPCLRNELYLRSHEGTLDAEVARLVDAMVSMGLLERNGQRLTRSSAAGAQLRLCAQIVQPFLERYYLGVAMLLGQGSGTQGRRAFVARCSDAAEQLSLIYALNSPDLFYPELFENFVEYLQSQGLAREDDDGYLAFEADMLGALATALGGMLQAQLRRTLVNLAGLAVTYPSGRAAGA
jgi:glycerol-3-phosphate O-acyltransferase